jgi:acetoacetyl-CoA synthetase
MLWSPSKAMVDNANLTHYSKWLEKNRGLHFTNYDDLWKWSVQDIPHFWESLLEYFEIVYEGDYQNVLSGKEMPYYRWFDGIKLNYAEHIFRKARTHEPAIFYKSETEDHKELSWDELVQQVASLQHYLKSIGVKRGDRVVAYLPATVEATVAFLAVCSLGAIWSSCSPDFGTQSVIDRFAQITPKVLIACTGYDYNGKYFDKTDVIKQLTQAMPGIQKSILIHHTAGKEINNNDLFVSWNDVVSKTNRALTFERVEFNDPIWVLYSSGTTGLPKAITHSHGGILLEQLKYGTFHNDFKPREKCFWFTTTGWMMWNYIQGCLLAGSTLVLYNGSPGFPDLNVLWKFADDLEIHHFGTSAGFILANMKANINPKRDFNLSNLRSIGSTGSTLPPEGFEWVYRQVKDDLWLASMSGGTDVCSAFVGGNPTLPVYSGEIQCRALGCDLHAVDELGKPTQDEVGEMVITSPMPSMPVYFWNDPSFERYRASYFEMFPGVWRHGDWIEITSRNTVIIYGRSDATLNRGGVRIGTSEIYRAVDKVKEVRDSLIVCIEKEGGQFWMPLFVVMNDGEELTREVTQKINATIRQDYSPRHVPDEIISVPDIPYTMNGKKTETPVKKILMGKDPDTVVQPGTLKNPASISFFRKWANRI